MGRGKGGGRDREGYSRGLKKYSGDDGGWQNQI